MPPDRKSPYGTSDRRCADDAIEQHLLQPPQRPIVPDRDRPARRQRRAVVALDDAAVFDGDGLAGQQPAYAGEDRLRTGGEFELEQFRASRRIDLGAHQPRRQQRRRFGGERELVGGLRVVERLDAERIARQDKPIAVRIVERDRIHAAQPLGEGNPEAMVEMQDRLAIRPGAKLTPAKSRRSSGSL